ncbi:leucine rich repeat-containing protein [Toxoplasma gondii ARI]|uniref:Leucine rich repeat-containing protein n=1 Tax=Toxoplasma gondii ARI TaxID=1074872 RepID=A0A139XLL6_TOXGO|nr:leucine rich repeat-containing protein [Toxoplasma gondii ARI]
MSASPCSIPSLREKSNASSTSRSPTPPSSAKRSSLSHLSPTSKKKVSSRHCGVPDNDRMGKHSLSNARASMGKVRQPVGPGNPSSIPSPVSKKVKETPKQTSVGGESDAKRATLASPRRPLFSGVHTAQSGAEKNAPKSAASLSSSASSSWSKGEFRENEARREERSGTPRAPLQAARNQFSPKSEKKCTSNSPLEQRAAVTKPGALSVSALRETSKSGGDEDARGDAKSALRASSGNLEKDEKKATMHAPSASKNRDAAPGGGNRQAKSRALSLKDSPASSTCGSENLKGANGRTRTSGGPRPALSRRPVAAVSREPITHLTLPRIAEIAASGQTPQTPALEKPAEVPGTNSAEAPKERENASAASSSSASGLDMAAISALDLSEREAEEVADLSCYKSLKRLDVSGNRLADGLGFLAMNLQLRWLKAARSLLEGGDVLRCALMNLSNLVVLDLSSNQITRLDAFAPLKALKTLVLSENQIQRVSFAASPLNSLECLILSRNKIQEIEKPPSPLTHLKKLSLSDNRLKTFPFCGQFPALLELRLNGNSLLSVGSGVTCMSELKILDLGRNQLHRIEGVKALAGHLKLNQLNILGNPLMSVASILNEVEEQVVGSLPNLKIFNSKPLQPRRENPRKLLWKQRQEAARLARQKSENKGENKGGNKRENKGENKGENKRENKGENKGENKRENKGENKRENKGGNKGEETRGDSSAGSRGLSKFVKNFQTSCGEEKRAKAEKQHMSFKRPAPSVESVSPKKKKV